MTTAPTERTGDRMPVGKRRWRGVIFDFDGIIVDTEVAVYDAWVEVYAHHGAELPLELYSRCVGSDHGSWDPKSYLEQITGLRPDWPPILDAKNQRTREMLAGENTMAGVGHWLETLSVRGVPMAVASSSSREWVGGWLKQLGLAGYFHSWHCRGDVAKVKPAPDLYLRALDALGLAADEVLVIEDSSHGLQAARTAGMDALVVPNRITRTQDFAGALMRTASLDDPAALALLERIG